MVIDRVLIVDTETTALDVSEGQVIEVGAILYSVRHQTVLQQVATLLPAMENGAERINRIPVAPLVEMSGDVAGWGMDMVMMMGRQAEYVVAHNADFDRKWFGMGDGDLPLLSRGMLPLLVDAEGAPLRWICTCADFEWPCQSRPGQSLIDLALAHGIGVGSAHRALTDCLLIAELFNRVADLQGLFERALRPKGRFVALVSFDERELAKRAGFKWYAESKTWERVMAIEDVAGLGFGVERVDDES